MGGQGLGREEQDEEEDEEEEEEEKEVNVEDASWCGFAFTLPAAAQVGQAGQQQQQAPLAHLQAKGVPGAARGKWATGEELAAWAFSGEAGGQRLGWQERAAEAAKLGTEVLNLVALVLTSLSGGNVRLEEALGVSSGWARAGIPERVPWSPNAQLFKGGAQQPPDLSPVAVEGLKQQSEVVVFSRKSKQRVGKTHRLPPVASRLLHLYLGVGRTVERLYLGLAVELLPRGARGVPDLRSGKALLAYLLFARPWVPVLRGVGQQGGGVGVG